MEARAKVKYIRQSPRKVRQIVDLIRGRRVDAAEDILRLSNRPAARRLQKLLKSAVANAVNLDETVDVDRLQVKHIVADPGPTMKRWLPRARGRATPILKRSTHVTIVVSDEG